MIELKRCAQIVGGEQCPSPAFYRYTWPGKDEAFICAGCAPKLRDVADALGLHLQLIPLHPEHADKA